MYFQGLEGVVGSPVLALWMDKHVRIPVTRNPRSAKLCDCQCPIELICWDTPGTNTPEFHPVTFCDTSCSSWQASP